MVTDAQFQAAPLLLSRRYRVSVDVEVTVRDLPAVMLEDFTFRPGIGTQSPQAVHLYLIRQHELLQALMTTFAKIDSYLGLDAALVASLELDKSVQSYGGKLASQRDELEQELISQLAPASRQWFEKAEQAGNISESRETALSDSIHAKVLEITIAPTPGNA